MRAKREACQGGLDLESISKRRKVIANSCNNSLIWFRTDLRTMNHAALSEASQVAKETNGVVIGLYVVHEEEWKRHFMSPAKSDLILRTLKTLRQRLLEEFNIPLYVCHLKEDSFVTAFNTLDPTLYGYAKNKIAVKGHLKELSDNRMHFAHWLAQFCQAHQVGSVFYHHEYEVDEKERDFIVAKVLSESGILVTPIHGHCLIPPGLVLTKLNKPYNVFTPFKNQWLGILDHQFDFLVMPLKEVLPNPKTDLLDLEALGEIPEEVIPIDKDLKLRIEVDWSCDERDILEKSKQYISSKVTQYHEQRDLPSLKDGTSKLSAYLAIGSMSIRTLAYELYLEFPKLFPLASTKYQNVAALKTTSSDGPSVYLSELCWRDFYRHIIYFYPKVSRGCTFQSITEKIAWREGVEAEKDFEAWKQGKTGFPIVDAAMVQLNKTGWMHNRCRMIVASFLTKDLLVIIYCPFMNHF